MSDPEVQPAAMVVHQPEASMTLFRTDDPGEIVVRATKVADALASILKRQNLTVTIGKRQHVLVEGWTLCGTLLGVFPVCVWTKPVRAKDDGAVIGWEARVEAKTRSGDTVGAAEAMAMADEGASWAKADYSIRSMAQTRATAKALRIPLGFIVTMAGYDATPADEMPDSMRQQGQEAFGRAAKAAPPSPYASFMSAVELGGAWTPEQAKDYLKSKGFKKPADVKLKDLEALLPWARGEATHAA